MQASHDEEVEHLGRQVAELTTRVDILNHQLNQMDKERSLVELDNKNMKRRLQIYQEDNCQLKEEVL